MASFVPVAEVEEKTFTPVAEVEDKPFVPVEEVNDSPTDIRSFSDAPDAQVSQTSPATPGRLPMVSGDLSSPAPKTESDVIQAQTPQGVEPVQIGGEIQPIGKEGTFTRGATSVIAGVLNRPEYLAAMLNPATAVAVGVRFAPEIAKQFVDDLGKATQGDNEALGRASMIGLPALLGMAKAGRTITERLNAQVALETARKASSEGYIDAMARLEMNPPSKPTLLPLSEATLKGEVKPSAPEEGVSNAGEIKVPMEVAGSEQAGPTPQMAARSAEEVQKPPGIEAASPDDAGAKAPPQETLGDVTTEGVIKNEEKVQEKGPEELLVSPSKPAVESEVVPTTAETPVTPAGQVETGGVKPRRKGIERPWDIIDEIESIGKIRRKSNAKPGSEGYYTDEFNALSKSGASRKLFSPDGLSPDDVLKPLVDKGVLGKDATVDDLAVAIEQANAQRRAIATGQTPEIQADKFQVALKNQGAKKNSQTVSVGDLGKGDKFKVGGEELEVVSIDPDTGDVTVKDGRKFGHQTIPDGADIPIEKGSFEAVAKVPAFGEEDFALNAAESVEQQKLRLAHEEAVAKQKADEEEMAARAEKPLVGSVGDIGQKDMFGGGDLFSEAPQRPKGMGGAVPSEFGTNESVVSNMFAAIDRDRAAMGKPPMEPGTPRTWSEDQSTAMARMNHDPQWIPDLIKEVLNKPRPLRSDEQAGMVMQKAFWKAEANNALGRVAKAFEDGREADLIQAKADAARFEDNLAQMEEAVGRGGTGSEAGRSLQAQKMGLTDDLTLVEMRLEMRGKLGGRPLTERESAEVSRIHKEYQEKTAALEKGALESERRRVEAETRATIAELARQAAQEKVPPPHIQRIIDRVHDSIKKGADEARARLKGKLFSIGDPEVLLDLARIGADNIWTIGEDFARWSIKMAEDIGERVKPHLAQIWEASKKLIDEVTDIESGAKTAAGKKTAAVVRETIKKGDTPEQKIAKLTARVKDRVTNGKKQPLAPTIQALARSLIEKGVRGRDELVNAVHEIVSPLIPNWDIYKTKQAISGYGDYRMLSKDEVSVILRDYKGQLQQMLKLEDMAFKKAPLRSGVEQREVTKAQADLVKLVNEAKRKGGYETTDPATQLRTALDEAKKRTQTAIEEYERRIKEKDYTVRKLTPIRPDAQLLKLQAEQARVKKKWEQAKRDAELAARKPWQKALDKFVKWERAFKLSSPVVFGKLTGAAITRVITTAAEEAVGGAAGLIPGIRTVAKQAPREGGVNVSAMAKGMTEAITKGMRDAWETAKSGASNLDVVFGEKLIDKDWANVFGQLHGMLKAPVKRAEFTLSLEKRIKFAIKNKIDVTDPLVMTRLATEALNDGYRAIFMQKGFTSDMFNTLVSLMEKSKKYPVAGEISARTLRFLLPVVRVPANIVAETSTGIYGAPLASARIMVHASRGTLSKLDPQVADAIMRQFKKGSIGLGLMALGYFNPQIFGGLDWREKRQPGAPKVAGIQIGGVDIPRWATHAPWFELMQLGATVRHVKDQHVKGQEKGIPEGLWAAGLGLIEETPLVNEMLHVDKLFDPNQRDQFVGELARSTIIPQAVQKIADIMDDSQKRKPKGIIQNIEMGIPGLRQNVPVKKSPKEVFP